MASKLLSVLRRNSLLNMVKDGAIEPYNIVYAVRILSMKSKLHTQ